MHVLTVLYTVHMLECTARVLACTCESARRGPGSARRARVRRGGAALATVDDGSCVSPFTVEYTVRALGQFGYYSVEGPGIFVDDKLLPLPEGAEADEELLAFTRALLALRGRRADREETRATTRTTMTNHLDDDHGVSWMRRARPKRRDC